MKSKILLLIALLITVYSCNNNDDDTNPQVIDGAYTGVFERNGTTSNVELNLENASFMGESATVKFPAICRGSFSISNHSINFINECPWTAEFDWTLILNREWNYELKNNVLILTNSNGDKYTLDRKE